MECLHKNIQFILEFLKGLFILLHFSYYTLMIFLMMLSVILLYAKNTVRVICGSIWSVATTWIGLWTWIWSTRHWTGAGSDLLIAIPEKLNWFRLTGLITLVLMMGQKMGLLRCWGWLFPLNWIGAFALSQLIKLPPRKFEPWFVLRLLCISISLPYDHGWNTFVMCCFLPVCPEMQNKNL